MPRQDDYDAILGFLVSFRKAGVGEKLSLLFLQHGEHRILASRLVYVLYLSLFGEINFRHIIFLNLGILILLFAQIAFFIRRLIPAWWLPATMMLSLCMFDTSNFENADFAMAGLQNYGIILLFTASMYAYSRKRGAWLAAGILLQLLCTYSSGNGIVASFFIVASCILSRNRRSMIAALIIFLVFVPLYYLHYTRPGNDFFTLNPSKFLPFFFHAIGAHFSNGLGIIAGVVLLALLGWLLPYRDVNEQTAPLIALTLFSLASMGVMSVFRGNLSADFAYVSRYHIYSHLLSALVPVFFIYRFRNWKSLPGVVFLCFAGAVFGFISNWRYGSEGFRNFYRATTSTPYDYPAAQADHARAVATEACDMKIYCRQR